MAREVIVRCDVCGQPGAVKYAISREDGERWEVELCIEHGKQILDLAIQGTKPPADPPSQGGNTLRALERLTRNVPDVP